MSNFFNDLESEEDYLGYLPYIEAFSYIINHHSKLISPPFVFGIHGKWGTGKSTFMKLINKKLEKNFYTIEINPWEYDENQNFTTIFLAKLYDKVKEKIFFRGKNSGNEFIKSIFEPLKLSLGGKLLKLEYDFSKFSVDQQKKVIDSFVSENFALKESINKLLNENLFENKKVIVFIDDLDRCSIEKIMQVIESIKLIFNSQNCIFFLACDTSYLEGAISTKHKDFIDFTERKQKSDNGENIKKNFSREYLEKIIQIPFYIPPISKESIKKYIKSVLINKRKRPKKINIDKENLFETFTNELGDQFISEIIVVANLNPRRIKRILNLIFLNYTFMRFKDTENYNVKIDIKLASLLVIIREVYPEYYKVKLSSETDCLKTFKDFFEQYYKEDKCKNDSEDEIENYEKNNMNNNFNIIYGNVYELFKIYFKYGKIDKNKLNVQLKNIMQYISVSSIMTGENYETLKWGNIGEVKANTNGKKLKIFLDKIYNNEPAKEIVLWFFNYIFLKRKDRYAFGLVKNIPVYSKNSDGNYDCKKNLLFRFEFEEKQNLLFINFEGKGEIKSILNNVQQYMITKKYNSEENKIKIDQNTNEEEIQKIKRGILKVIKFNLYSVESEVASSIK